MIKTKLNYLRQFYACYKIVENENLFSTASDDIEINV